MPCTCTLSEIFLSTSAIVILIESLSEIAVLVGTTLLQTNPKFYCTFTHMYFSKTDSYFMSVLYTDVYTDYTAKVR